MERFGAGLGISTAKGAASAVKAAVEQAKQQLGANVPSLCLVTATVEHPAAEVFSSLRRELPNVPIHGITTAHGVLGVEGMARGRHGAVGILLLAAGGTVSFAVGSAPIEEDGRAAGRIAAGRIASRYMDARPRVLLFHCSPGLEEEALEGVAEVFPGVPVYGGSASDESLAGGWTVFTNDGPRTTAVSLAAVYGAVEVGGAFLAPYDATDTKARVTLVSGRTLHSLDGRPAADVLGGWVGDAIAQEVRHGGTILEKMALAPLGVRRATEHFLTVHPASVVKPGNAVKVFAQVHAGDTVCLMSTTEKELLRALSPLVDQALAHGNLEPHAVKAGVLIYCAGCAGAVGRKLDRALREHVGRKLPGVPLLGMCTFGEQGFVSGLGNLHQNLTLGLVLLGEG